MAGSATIPADISGPAAFVKAGAGTLTLTGSDSYTGPTFINSGLVTVTGTLTSGGAVLVNRGGILTGSGAIARSILVADGGELIPGNDGRGRLTTGSVTFQPGSVFVVSLDGPIEGVDYGQLAVSGSVDLGNATLVLRGGFQPAPGTIITLVANDDTDAVASSFSGLPEAAQITVGAFSGILSYLGGNGNDVTLTVGGSMSFADGNTFVLRRSAGNLQVLRDGALIDSRPMAAVNGYTFKGSGKAPASLTVDFASGGFFTVADGINFSGGGGGTLNVVGGNFAEVDDILAGPDGGPMTFTDESGQTLQLNYGGVTVADLSAVTTTTLSIRLPDSSDVAVLEENAGVSHLASVSGAFTTTFFNEPKGKLIVDTAGGDDNLTVIRTAPTAAPLTIYGGAGTNILAIDLSAATAPDVLTLTASTVTSTALGGPITFAGTFSNFTLTAGNGQDIVNVLSTLAGAVTSVRTGSGDDLIVVSSDPSLGASDLSNLGGILVIDAGGGSNQLKVSNTAPQIGDKVWVSNRSIAGTVVPYQVVYQATGGNFNHGITLFLGDGNDTVLVQGLFLHAPTTIYSRGGDDTFHVAVTVASAYQFTLDGGAGTDSLFVWDNSGGAVMHDLQSVAGLGVVTVDYLDGALSTVHYQNLEQHQVSVDPESSYIQALYNDTLGFKAGPDDLASWVNVLHTSGRTAVVQALEDSAPGRDHLVQGWYQRYLGFKPAAGTDQFWVDQLTIHSEEEVLANFLASEGYAARASAAFGKVSSDEAFVRQLYLDLLKRGLSDGELQTILGSLLPQVGRSGLAWLVLTSQEYLKVSMIERYTLLLNRQPGDGDLQVWGSSGLAQEQIDVLFKSSDEFYASGL